MSFSLVSHLWSDNFQWKWIRHKGLWEAEEKCQKSKQRVTLQLVLNASFVWVLDWAGMHYDKYKMILVFSHRVFSTQLFKRKKKLRIKNKTKQNTPKQIKKTQLKCYQNYRSWSLNHFLSQPSQIVCARLMWI